MTTHDQSTDITDMNTIQGFSPEETRLVSSRPSPATDTAPGGLPDSGAQSRESAALFADDELAAMRTRWNSVQAGFVDDPRKCVTEADGLVSDLTEKLTAGFADSRSRLEEKWTRGETASTEDLRVALRNYREFFERLLSV